MATCSFPGCKCRVLKHDLCQHHRPRNNERKVTPEQRDRYNATAREKYRRQVTVLQGVEVL